MTCKWWNRWYHRKLRRLDRRFMAQSLWNAITKYNDGTPVETFEKMWDQFIHEPGQEHWQCDCAKKELQAEKMP